jgi:hypothetical protein
MQQDTLHKFHCTYELDTRLDRDLIGLSQVIYRELAASLGPNYRVPMDENNIPKAVPFYLLYLSALVYGAADAAVTLTLHNLGREARIIERQLFEYWVRSSFYSENPELAQLAMYSTASEERKILDGLNYPRDSDRYRRVMSEAALLDDLKPDAVKFREPSLQSMLSANDSAKLKQLYTLHYRIASQIAHGAFAGIGMVIGDEGVTFDSRIPEPNNSIQMVILYVLGFFQILNRELELGVSETIEGFKTDFERITSRLNLAI